MFSVNYNFYFKLYYFQGAIFNHSEEKEDAESLSFKPEDEMNNIIDELQSWKVHHEK